MNYEHPDSSGTDDDLRPRHFNRVPAGAHVAGNGRPIVGSSPYQRMHNDMESQIHYLEQEAYCSVLRAFKAQSDALSWEKEGLITELRKELRVSDDEHRDLLSKVNADDVICKIREWRKSGGIHSAMLNVPQSIQDRLPSPTFSASRKKQKTSQSVPQSFGMQSQALHPQSIAATMQPSSLTTRYPSSGLGSGGRKPKPGQPRYGLTSMNSIRYPSSGPSPRSQIYNQGFPAGMSTNESTEAASDPLVGRRVMTRWPEDNNFYEAFISDYDPVEGRHAFFYDKGTADESWEWVDLKEIRPEDIRWIDDGPGISHPGSRVVQGYGVQNTLNHGGKGKGNSKGLFEREFPPPQNGGVVKNGSEVIEILHTDTLIKEVEKMFGTNRPDFSEIQKAKKMLKDHEQALMNVIAKLGDASDNESDGDRMQLDRGQGIRYINAETRGVGADGDGMARGQDNHQDDDDEIIEIE